MIGKSQAGEVVWPEQHSVGKPWTASINARMFQAQNFDCFVKRSFYLIYASRPEHIQHLYLILFFEIWAVCSSQQKCRVHIMYETLISKFIFHMSSMKYFKAGESSFCSASLQYTTL